MGARLWFLLAGALVGTGCGYAPGRLLSADAAHARRLACLEVGVALVGDAHAPPSDPVVQVSFGNRCRDPVPVDFGQLRVTARYPGAAAPEAVLQPFDPDREIRPALLGGRRSARETIEFLAPAGMSAVPTDVCVDVSNLEPGRRAEPVCFGDVRS
jgi:hypothetical protein